MYFSILCTDLLFHCSVIVVNWAKLNFIQKTKENPSPKILTDLYVHFTTSSSVFILRSLTFYYYYYYTKGYLFHFISVSLHTFYHILKQSAIWSCKHGKFHVAALMLWVVIMRCFSVLWLHFNNVNCSNKTKYRCWQQGRNKWELLKYE